MALKAKLTAEEHGKLAPDLQSSYKKSGDAFVLDVEGIDDLSDLTSAFDRLKGETKKLRDEASALRVQADKVKDVDPEKYQQLLTEAAERDKEAKEKKGEYDAIVKQMNEAHAAELKKKDAEVAAMRATLEEHLIEANAIAAIAEFKGEPVLLLPIVRKRTRVVKRDDGKYAVQVVDEAGNPQVDGSGNPLSIKALVEGMKADKIYGRAFEANGQSGGGPSPNRRDGSGPLPAGNKASSLDKIKSGLEKTGMVR